MLSLKRWFMIAVPFVLLGILADGAAAQEGGCLDCGEASRQCLGDSDTTACYYYPDDWEEAEGCFGLEVGPGQCEPTLAAIDRNDIAGEPIFFALTGFVFGDLLDTTAHVRRACDNAILRLVFDRREALEIRTSSGRLLL